MGFQRQNGVFVAWNMKIYIYIHMNDTHSNDLRY